MAVSWFGEAESDVGKSRSHSDATWRSVHSSRNRNGKRILGAKSARQERAFRRLRCRQLRGVRGELAAAQLFGHIKGAFTSANNSTPGALRRADKGTVFLDEVAELPLESQALLLRATQTQEVTPVGSSLPIHSNFRVICASHTSLIELVGRQAFRADLYYRLTSHQLSLPPLQQRKEDIVALFERASGIPTKRLQTRLVEQLLLHEWPGNVRELENAAIAVQALPGEPETWAQLPFLPAVATGGEPAPVEQHALTKPPSEDNPIPSTRQMSPRQWQELYAKHHGNAAEVARATGLQGKHGETSLRGFPFARLLTVRQRANSITRASRGVSLLNGYSRPSSTHMPRCKIVHGLRVRGCTTANGVWVASCV